MKMLRIHPLDNVAVVLEDTEEIPYGHKISLCDIAENAEIIKYGNRIGFASKAIKKGEHVHVHNLKTALCGKQKYEYNPVKTKEKSDKSVVFSGFSRENGKAGIRNEIWIIPTVGCVNGIVKTLEQIGRKLKKGSVNEVVGFTHPYGCSQLGDDQEATRKILAGLINHPNAGGVLVVGLGCENSGIETLKSYIGNFDSNRVKFLQAQDFTDEIAAGESMLAELIETAVKYERSEIPVSALTVGLKCGGSDGFSGITANPVVGIFSDILISMEGTAILTEVPEMFGAEHLLMSRAENETIFNQTVDLINEYKDYFEKAGVPVYENPSPGNKKGGISTLEEKSLGCTQKSGNSKICGVAGYGEKVIHKGLNLLSAPGNDLVAATALAAAGAQIVLFTTGLGTPFASPVPTVKISSNTPLFERKRNWIDFDAGIALENKTIEETGQELFRFVVQAASGRLLKSEEIGFYDMAILKSGVTL